MAPSSVDMLLLQKSFHVTAWTSFRGMTWKVKRKKIMNGCKTRFISLGLSLFSKAYRLCLTWSTYFSFKKFKVIL